MAVPLQLRDNNGFSYISENLKVMANKSYATPTIRYSVFRCGDCGAIGREREGMNKSRKGYLKRSIVR